MNHACVHTGIVGNEFGGARPPMMLIRTTRVTYKQSKKHSQITTNTSSSIIRTGDKGRLAFWDVKNSVSGL